MIGKHLFLGVALAALPFNAASAADCSCVAAGDVVVSGVSGDVRISGKQGFNAVAPGTALGAGSRLTTGADSAARISGAGCQLSVAPNTDIDVSPVDAGGLCLVSNQVTSVPQVGKDAAYGQTLSVPPLPLLIVGGAIVVAGVAAAVVLSDDDDASD